MKIAFIGDSLTQGIPGSSYVAILRQRLPEHELVNLGKANDTVVSLYRRMARLHFDTSPFDLAFLWIGVNDVVENPVWLMRFIHALIGQPRARNLDQFQSTYRQTLDLLCRHTRHVIAVPPVLKGEDLSNPWNREVERLAHAIEGLAAGYEQVDYLDLRAVFIQALAGRPVPSYVPNQVVHLALDTLCRRHRGRSEHASANRGLHLTIDGVHLNSTGAALVAETFLSVIEEQHAP